MKNKLLLVCFISMMLSKSSLSQYRISIDSSNTFSNDLKYGQGLTFLIDVPLGDNVKSLYVDNKKGIIPIQLLFQERNRRWTKLDTLVISENVNKKETVIKRQNAHQYMLDEYIFITFHVDTLNGIDDRFSNYKILSPFLHNNIDSVKVYYTDEYGSVCCPVDPKYKMKPSLDEFLKTFEERNKTKIGKIYFKSLAKEGEIAFYFTLDNLTQVQKIDFLNQMSSRQWSLNPNAKNKDYHMGDRIFMPFLISKRGLKEYNY